MDLANATDLVHWAQRHDAQAQLPQLVRRLIAATADGLSRLSVRAGEGVALPGWDGVAEAARQSTFVPSGISVWEMGVGAPVSKADGDYRKRTEQPGDVSPADATFVFVTPRRWSGKENWAKERTEEGAWGAVIAYDADDLETWLESAPAVHAWISTLLGKDPSEAESLETWWSTWSCATRPAIPPALVLSGREQEAEQLRGFLAGEPATTSVAADSQSEALAFIAASILKPKESSLIERALVVRSSRAWRQLAVSPTPLLLLPTFEQPAVAPAVQSGHYVVLPVSREVAGTHRISLPRLRRAGIEAALLEAGLHHDRASSFATLGRRSLLSLRRTLAINPDTEVPEWAHPEHAPDVVPAVLAGTWHDSSEGDREAVAAIAGRPYDDVTRVLTRWLHAPDPPVRRVGDVWMVAAKADTWVLTASALTSDALSRFRQLAIDVLGGDDPALDFPPDQRMMAGLLGRQRSHSGHLVRGIADTLALMATMSDDVPLPGERRGDAETAVIVRSLLQAANKDPTGRRWHSLSDVLPLLAEAAPTKVLQAIEAGSQSADGPVLHLFQDGEQSSFYSSGSPHCSLLWALEVLAWVPDYLPHAALQLATLARLDPGGRTLNRPFNSLRDILLLWRPGTAASLDERVQVVDLIRHREPDVAWRLMLRLIPPGRDTASSTASPDRRDWKPESTGGVFAAGLVRAVELIVERAAADAGVDGTRWAALLARLVTTYGSAYEIGMKVFQTVDPSSMNSVGRVAVYRTLRKLVNSHRQFPDADWTMPAAAVHRLAELIPRFVPDDLVGKHSWLFDEHALDAFLGDDREERLLSLAEAQDEALREILDACGFDGILDWAATLAKPDFSAIQISNALCRTEHPLPELLGLLASEREMDRRIAMQFISIMARKDWPNWGAKTLKDHCTNWLPQHQALFLRALPASLHVWKLAEELGPEIERLYWADMHPYWLPSGGSEAIVAAEKLVEFGRARSALHLLAVAAHRDSEPVPHELVAHALEEAIRTAEAPFESTLANDIGDHLERLADAGFDKERLARLEWAYLPLFRFETREFRVLHRALAEDPLFFVELVSLVYRAADEEPRELTHLEQAKADSAHNLLESWRVVPGARPDGTIDADDLNEWVRTARKFLAEAKRVEVGEQMIGRVLRYGPPPQPAQNGGSPGQEQDEDVENSVGAEWPGEPIRDVIESAASEHIETGIQLEVFNSRGVTTRGLTDGGQQEHAIAEGYRRYAENLGMRWPRTAAMLKRIADSYEHDAAREDRSAELTEDLWR